MYNKVFLSFLFYYSAYIFCSAAAETQVANGNHSGVSGANLTVGEAITWFCQEGYEILGQATQTCGVTAAFDVSPPKCLGK